MDPLFDFEEIANPPVEQAVYGLAVMARKAPQLMVTPLDKDHEDELATKKLQMNLYAGFALNALQKHFRDGFPVDAPPDFYESIDKHNANQVDHLYSGTEAKLWIGHANSFVILILNMKGPDVPEHTNGFQVDCRTPKVMCERAEALTEYLTTNE